jgi:hypothetical protein
MAIGRRFEEHARRERGPGAKLFLVFVAIVAAAMLWAQRGPTVGAIAIATFGAFAVAAVVNRGDLIAWSRRHIILDALFLAPTAFLALALCTDWAIGICAAIGAAAGGLLVPLALQRRR